MNTGTVTVGALIRRQFRAMLDVNGVEWTEHKGWLDSVFVIRGTECQMEDIQDLLDRAIAMRDGE